MILLKLWYDLRWRFLFCFAFAVLNVLMLIFLFPLLRPFLLWMKADIPAAEWAQLDALLSSYRIFIDHGWFQETQKFALFAVILALGGIMTEQKSHTSLFSLSLPVSRRNWILYQAGFVFASVIALCSIATVILLIGSFIYGDSYPFAHAVQQTFLVALLTIPWIGATIAVTSVMQDKLKTGVLIAGIGMCIGVLSKLQDVKIWLPRHVLDSVNGEPFPWQALITIFVVGVGGVILAIQQFEARDF